MPGRLEFDLEYDNESEQFVKDMVFEDTDTPEDISIFSTFYPDTKNTIDRNKTYCIRHLQHFINTSARTKKIYV